MKPTLRLSLLVLAGCLSAAAPAPSRSEEFAAIDGQGADPLLDAYPFFIFPNSTKTAQIVYETDRQSTSPIPVTTLDVQCCTDPSGASVQPTDITFEAVSSLEPPPSPPSGVHHVQPALQPNEFIPVPGVARLVWLKVTTGPHPTPGRYLATVKASLAGDSRSTQVIVNVLPDLVDSVTPRCVAFTATTGPKDIALGSSPAGASLVPSDSLVLALKPLFDAKAKNPSQASTSLDIGWAVANAENTGNNGIQITLSSGNLPLAPTQALLFFLNSTGRNKEFVAFDSALCVPVSTTLLQSGESTSILADGMTTTMFVRRNISNGWENLSVLSGPLLWTLLGGRQATFNWIISNNEH